jgi:uncharacterized protein YjbI with pentapeptide repeats
MQDVTRLRVRPLSVGSARRRRVVAVRILLALYLTFTYSCKSHEQRQRDREREASRPFREQLERTNACPGCDIRWIDFTGKNFAGADLRGAHLFMVVAPDSNFRGANLTGGMLFGQLQRADLRDMTVHDGTVCGNLDEADLRGSVFSGRSDLEPDSARAARFDGLDLRTIKNPYSGNWSGASLRGANLRGLVMNGMTGAYKRIPAVPSRLEAGYGGSRWAGADLRDADLRDTSFNSCDLSNADLRGALVSGASFSGANLEGAQLSLDLLADADFGAATWLDGTTCDGMKSIGQCTPFKPQPIRLETSASARTNSKPKSPFTPKSPSHSGSPSAASGARTPNSQGTPSLTSASP